MRSARLDPYRNQVALLSRAGHLVGYLLVLTKNGGRPAGRRLWGRGPATTHEVVTTKIKFNDGSDPVHERVAGDGVDVHLDQWQRSELRLAGEVLTLHWLGPVDSERVIRQQFDGEGLDPAGRAG